MVIWQEGKTPGSNIGYVCYLSLISRVDGKFPVQAVGGDVRRPSCNPPGGLVDTYCLDFVGLHEPRHTITAAGFTGFAQVTKDAVRTVDATLAEYELRITSSNRASSLARSDSG